MSGPTLRTVPPEIGRDRWGRPLVVPPGGGKPVPYTRCTTFVGTVEDRYALEKWKMRQVALGLVDRKDLRLGVAAHRDDKQRLNELCDAALEAAESSAAATIGTGLHALTEQHDRGLAPVVPDDYVADLTAYAQATAELKAVYIEQFCVQDPLKVGGTPDRVVRYRGKRYIADLKTGKIEYGHLSIAAQLAMYARSRPYDVARGERMDPHGCEVDRGIVIHLPAGTGRCTLYWVDLLAGWEAVRVARDIRAQRQLKFRELLTELVPDAAPAPPTVADLIAASRTYDDVKALWAEHAAVWTDELTELAKKRIAHIAAQPAPERSTA